MKDRSYLEQFRKIYPEKFALEEKIFSHIHAGDRIFIGTGCGEPQYLLAALVNYVKNHPKAFFDAELIHIWTLGVAPYADEKLHENFRLDSFFVGDSTRNSVNRGEADYTPIFLSAVPDLFRSELIRVDVALVQTSLPDKHGYLSLGISVDVVKSAVEKAGLVVVQVNSNMPRTHGDGFINIKDIDFVIAHDEPLLEYSLKAPSDIVQKIGRYVASLIEDGSTIQVGYGLIRCSGPQSGGQEGPGRPYRASQPRHNQPHGKWGGDQQQKNPQSGQDRSLLLHGRPGELRLPG